MNDATPSSKTTNAIAGDAVLPQIVTDSSENRTESPPGGNALAQHSTAKPRKARNRGGAPLGNRNNLRHGLRAGRLPPGCSWIAASTAELRAALESGVLRVRGEVTILDASAINTAVRCERHALLCQRELRNSWDRLNFSERLAYSREITTASAARDKAIDRLGLNELQKSGDPWAALNGPPPPPLPHNNAETPVLLPPGNAVATGLPATAATASAPMEPLARQADPLNVGGTAIDEQSSGLPGAQHNGPDTEGGSR